MGGGGRKSPSLEQGRREGCQASRLANWKAGRGRSRFEKPASCKLDGKGCKYGKRAYSW